MKVNNAMQIKALVAIISLFTACGTGARQKNLRLSDVHYRLGEDYLGKKMPDSAKTELVRAIKYREENADAHGLLGVIYFFEGMHALDYGQRQLCLRGNSKKQQNAVADENFKLARKHIQWAISIDSEQTNTWSERKNYLANIALHFGNYGLARKLATEALDNLLYVNRTLALNIRGQASFKSGNFARAERDFRQAVFHQPTNCSARYWMGRTLYKTGRIRSGVSEWQQISKDSQCPLQELDLDLGRALLRVGDRDNAILRFKKCLETSPNSCKSDECRRALAGL